MKNFKYSILKDFILVIRQSDGPVVWGVAVCVRVGMRFCKVPVNGAKLSRHDKIVQMTMQKP